MSLNARFIAATEKAFKKAGDRVKTISLHTAEPINFDFGGIDNDIEFESTQVEALIFETSTTENTVTMSAVVRSRDMSESRFNKITVDGRVFRVIEYVNYDPIVMLKFSREL